MIITSLVKNIKSMRCIYAILLFLNYFLLQSCVALDKITASQFLKYPETMVSSNGAFKLGFFSPPSSKNHYAGIWYSKDLESLDVVWVANRNKPLNDSSGGVIKISEDGNLQLLNGRNETLWSSNASLSGEMGSSAVAQLQNSGNLVLQEENDRILWQSFENPTDTALPNMKLTVTNDSDMRKMLQSWKGPSDPSYGRFSVGIDSFAFPELVIWDGEHPYWRSGPWNGHIFIGMQNNDSNTINSGFILQNDRQGTVSLTYSSMDDMILSYYELSYQGILTKKWWDESKREWQPVWQAPATDCDVYGKCGAFGICNPMSSPICRCLKGFEPKNKLEWSKGNWTGGCVRRTLLKCGMEGGKQDGFFRVKTVKVPDLADWLIGLDNNECRSQCLNNCSCLAYVYIPGAGCMSWGKDLIDTEELSTGGVDFFVQLAHSELESSGKGVIIAAVTVSIGAVSVIILIFLLWWGKIQRQGKELQRKKTVSEVFGMEENQEKLEEVPLFEFEKLAMATNFFHDSNKLGQGGFGAVYRGRLEGGQEIAVKRLSRASGQGQEEFE